ncbi:DNA primase [uncultured Pleomorphomonas sp.]|uniref:DNA primase n=1 Tax=uncultured Pleomorphomonas sp. TaxID=442121 RepID=A0A212L215_9HYPH|nr:DNA primase [uncultured Pleomorphomonas sp.]SCM71556.1 DNA primase [uncultured Pleomorphomonas sp.]
MRFPPHILDEIRVRMPVSELVGKRVTWDKRKSQPAKGDYWACCPFHGEKTASFHVDDRRGIYHCFGCGVTGDVFRWMTDMEKHSFPEAVEELARITGVKIPRDEKAEKEEKLYLDGVAVMEEACRFFEASLRLSGGEAARAYVGKRELKPETVKEFRIGYAPAKAPMLREHLTGKGVSIETMQDLGLVRARDDGSVYDFFRDRLMIPIQDHKGRVIAFGGRALNDEVQPKYLNSPDTPLFDKSRTVFNVHRALKPAREASICLVVEGYMDVISVYQSGFLPVVAGMGTAITEAQIARFWRLAPEPVMCLDGDKAGVSAAHRAVDRILPALKAGHSFNFAFLPDGKDPDDIARVGGRDAIAKAIEGASPLVDVLWRRETDGAQLNTPERRAALEKRLYDLIDTIADRSVRASYRTAVRIRLSDMLWRAEKGAHAAKAPVLQAVDTGSLAAAIEAQARALDALILGLAVEYPALIDTHAERFAALRFGSEAYEAFKGELLRLIDDGPFDPASIDERFGPVLREVHGDDVTNAVGMVTRNRGYRVRDRLMILRFSPGPDLVERVFLGLLDRKAILDAEEEVRASIAAVSDDEEAGRIMAVLDDIQARKIAYELEQKLISEEVKALRSATGA